MPFSPPVALTIAGSDCSGGAGVQADLKTFSAMGCYGLTALTAVVAEIPGRVASVQLLEPSLVREQIEILAAAYPIRAVKTGMLGGRDQIEAILDAWPALGSRAVPLVIDPVMVSTSGSRLFDEDAMGLLLNRLIPLATLITPNLDEASVLLGMNITSRDEMERAAQELARRHSCAVLLKGGHLPGEESPDVLAHGEGADWFKGKRTPGVKTHGTGCVYSAAITACLAYGLPLVEAVRRAKEFVSRAISSHFRWGALDALASPAGFQGDMVDL